MFEQINTLVPDLVDRCVVLKNTKQKVSKTQTKQLYGIVTGCYKEFSLCNSQPLYSHVSQRVHVIQSLTRTILVITWIEIEHCLDVVLN